MRYRHFHHIGKRQTQQDRFYINSEHSVFVVCDGVGGSADGAKAAQDVVNHIKECLMYLNDTISIKDFEKLLHESANVLYTDRHSYEKASKTATTLAALHIQDREAHASHLGDSKVIYISNKGKHWASKDHSVIQELYDSGVISSQQEMQNHPMRNRITKAITNTEFIDVADIAVHNISNIQEGDLFLVCSDGALESYTPTDLIRHFSNRAITLDSRWQLFVDECLMNSRDNTTCLLIEV